MARDCHECGANGARNTEWIDGGSDIYRCDVCAKLLRERQYLEAQEESKKQNKKREIKWAEEVMEASPRALMILMNKIKEKLKKPIYLLAFTLLKIRTGVSFACIQGICWLFQVVLVANYLKDLNMVQLEIIPRSIERQRKKEIPTVENIIEGIGDLIPKS